MLLTAVVDAYICTADGVFQSVTNSQLDSRKIVPICIREANCPCFKFAKMYIMFWGSGITRMPLWGGQIIFATEMFTIITMENSALKNMGITLFTKEPSKIADPHLVWLSLLLCRWFWRLMLLCSRVTLEVPDKTLLHDSSSSENAVNQRERLMWSLCSCITVVPSRQQSNSMEKVFCNQISIWTQTTLRIIRNISWATNQTEKSALTSQE